MAPPAVRSIGAVGAGGSLGGHAPRAACHKPAGTGLALRAPRPGPCTRTRTGRCGRRAGATGPAPDPQGQAAPRSPSASLDRPGPGRVRRYRSPGWARFTRPTTATIPQALAEWARVAFFVRGRILGHERRLQSLMDCLQAEKASGRWLLDHQPPSATAPGPTPEPSAEGEAYGRLLSSQDAVEEQGPTG